MEAKTAGLPIRGRCYTKNPYGILVLREFLNELKLTITVDLKVESVEYSQGVRDLYIHIFLNFVSVVEITTHIIKPVFRGPSAKVNLDLM